MADRDSLLGTDRAPVSTGRHAVIATLTGSAFALVASLLAFIAADDAEAITLALIGAPAIVGVLAVVCAGTRALEVAVVLSWTASFVLLADLTHGPPDVPVWPGMWVAFGAVTAGAVGFTSARMIVAGAVTRLGAGPPVTARRPAPSSPVRMGGGAPAPPGRPSADPGPPWGVDPADHFRSTPPRVRPSAESAPPAPPAPPGGTGLRAHDRPTSAPTRDESLVSRADGPRPAGSNGAGHAALTDTAALDAISPDGPPVPASTRPYSREGLGDLRSRTARPSIQDGDGQREQSRRANDA